MSDSSIAVDSVDRDEFNSLMITHQAKLGKKLNQQKFFKIIKEYWKVNNNGK
jgi:hypothetical protein